MRVENDVNYMKGKKNFVAVLFFLNRSLLLKWLLFAIIFLSICTYMIILISFSVFIFYLLSDIDGVRVSL